MLRTIEGAFQVTKEARFALVVSRFNHFITDRLVEGALDGLRRHGVADAQITLVRVPGAFELPLIVADLAKQKRPPTAIIALGAVIRGATAHFDFVAGEAAKGCAAVQLQTGVPVVFGVLTTDTIEQAVERAGTKSGNKGFEAALTAIEIANLRQQLVASK